MQPLQQGLQALLRQLAQLLGAPEQLLQELQVLAPPGLPGLWVCTGQSHGEWDMALAAGGQARTVGSTLQKTPVHGHHLITRGDFGNLGDPLGLWLPYPLRAQSVTRWSLAISQMSRCPKRTTPAQGHSTRETRDRSKAQVCCLPVRALPSTQERSAPPSVSPDSQPDPLGSLYKGSSQQLWAMTPSAGTAP